MLEKMAKNFIRVDGEEEKGDEIKRQKFISGSKGTSGERGVVYLSNVPHGFYENQMFKFFSQFGKVTNVRLGRSKKTGNFKGYAFVEFRFADVAKIVAESMNNYLMHEKLMKAKVVPPEKVRPAIFKHRVNPEKPPGKKARQMAKKQVNMVRDERQEKARRRKQYSSIQKSTARLREFGVDISAQLPDIEAEKEERKKRMIKEGRTPVMAVDDSDLDITLKTPPNVRKIKSRQNSAALSGATPISGKFKSGGKNRELLVAKTATPTIDEVVKKKSKLFSAKKSKKL